MAQRLLSSLKRGLDELEAHYGSDQSLSSQLPPLKKRTQRLHARKEDAFNERANEIMEDTDATCNDAIHVLKSKLGIYSFQTELASGSAEVRQLAHEVLTDLDATKAKLLQAGQAVRDMELARYLNDGLVGQMKTLSGILNHVEKQLADEKTKSKKSLADANDKISELQQLRSTFDAAMQILEDMFKGREKELEAELRQASDVNDSLRGQLAAEKAVVEDKKAALSKLRWKMVLDAVLLRVRDARLQAGRRALEEHQN
jgi:hypothetical protein